MTPLSPRQRFSAGALALSLHVLFIAALVISVSWRHVPEAPAYADLWTSLPAPPPPRPEPPVRAEPVAPPPRPEPVAPPPRPEPKVEAKPVPKPDIALKAQEEKKRQQEKQRLEEERQKAEAKKAEEEARQKAEAARQKAEAEKRAREEKEQALKRALAQQMEAEIDREGARLAQMQQQAQAAAARDRLVDDYRAKIVQKVRGYIRLPANLAGNPEVVFQVTLLPNGEVQGVTMARSSGQPLYDQEVERAILKASPLPLPPDPAAAAAFRAGLVLKFRPHER